MTQEQSVSSPAVFEDTSYTYDLQNTLTALTKGSSTTSFTYYADGLRFKKSTSGVHTQYNYNFNGEVITEEKSNGQKANYVRGDRVLVKKDKTASKDYYYLYNGHGDVVQIVDTSGKPVNSYSYDVWGNITNQTEGISNPFKYTGEIYDEETGLYYLRARYYDPSMGRFLNEDTVEGQINNPLTQNLYTYVYNNPLIFSDPTGHWGQQCSLGDSACSARVRAEQAANVDALYKNMANYLNTGLDNLNAFGPAGMEISMGLKGAGYGLKYIGGVIEAAFAAKSIKTTISVVNAGEDVWKMGWSTRGLKIDALLGNNLGAAFPTVDKLSNRVVTSIKSYDIGSSYQKAGAWLSQLKKDIRTLNGLTTVEGIGTNGKKMILDQSMYDSKMFQIAIPNVKMNSSQVQALIDATEYAKNFGISIITTIVK
ncbi:RHS repeat-associated core domain-containing protein [Paenibacillus donghaensis]|uniref:RHS repeat-associated core domain-containing protein n=1 Tax=Paenibacillus donghaensis TaxID=414771 RepID=UPI001FEA3A4E|nr:RHS repeat-associated core domain-containing protein [Paenibacillus donghaensis]